MTRLRQLTAYLVTLVACFFCAGGMVVAARAAEPIPRSPSPHYIYDSAGWLRKADFEAIDTQLKSFERDTSSQILVAIFPKIPDGEEMFDFSQHVFEAWKPGLKGKDNGAIFFLFAADHKIRIHTGRGLEGVLPDARCKQIIENTVLPLLRKQDNTGAVTEGVRSMIAAAKGEYQGTGKTRLDGKGHSGNPVLVIVIAIIVLGFVVRFPGLFFQLATNIVFSSLGSSNGNWGGSGNGDSGGFSGGGGDSGGGGASGSW